VAERSQGRLERARAGDAQAFDELLGTVLDPAFRLAMTMLKDRAAAEDAVQEAAFKLWRRLDGIRSEAELRPWFLTVTANQCRSARRTRWWRTIRLADIRPAGAPAGRPREDVIDLDAALDRLPRHHLLALVLYYHLDLPVDEVARVFGCSENAARQRIHRALVALRPGLALEGNS
jgi:RNA polymerase sigma-70 factor, ECF subfamily